MRIHLGKKDHKCPHCDYSSVRKDNLRSHMKTHDKINNQSTTKKRTTPTSGLSTFLNQRFSSPIFKNSDKNRNHFYNLGKLHKNLDLNYASNRFYPSTNSSFQYFSQPNTFAYHPLDPVIKRRRFEEQTVNKRFAKLTDTTEQQTRMETDQSVKDKYTQQEISSAIEKSTKKHCDLFRPYEDLVTKIY